MTRLLFLPDDQTFLYLESAETVEEIVRAIESGEWLPPVPFDRQLQAESTSEQRRPLRVLCLGRLVIVAPMQPLELPPDTLTGSRAVRLSPRQRQVLEALADGLDTKQIAERLGIGRRAVLLYINNLKNILGASTRAQTVGRGVALGLCKPGKTTR